MKKIFVISIIGFASLIVIAAFRSQATFASAEISNVSVINIMSSGAQATWTTDIPSNSNVYYGTSSGSYSNSSGMRCDSGGMVTSHCVNLMYLSPGTTYYYKVSSTDEFSTNSVSDGHQFTSSFESTSYTSSSSSSVTTTTTTYSSSSSYYSTAQIPEAPSNIHASITYPNSVNISWADNSSNETRFDIYRRTTNGTWGFLTSRDSGYLAYYDMGLSAGTYEYSISACNSYGCSTAVFSAAVIVSGTTATSGSSSSGSVTTTTTTTTTSNSSSSSYVTTTNYVTTTTLGSSSSNSITTTNATQIPAAPSNVYAVLIYSNSVNISWADNSSNETYFEIYRRLSTGTWNRLASIGYLPYYDTSPSTGTYEYFVKACNSYGCSAPSYSGAVTISGATTASGSSSSGYVTTTTTAASSQIPEAPSKISVSLAYPNSVNISWADNSLNETRFDLYRRTTNGTWTLAASKSSGYASHYETGLSTGTYEYFVTACNSYGCSMAIYSTGVLISGTAAAASSSSSFSYVTATTTAPVSLAIISGTVSDSFGRSVLGSFIYFTQKTSLDSTAASQSYNATTDSFGAFRVYLPAGKYTIETFPPSGQNYLKPSLFEVALSSGETRNIYINYPAGGKTLRGAAMFLNGKAITDAEIGAYRRENGQWVRAFTDTSGKFEINLSGGTWEISIYPRNGQIEKWEAQLPRPTIIFTNDSQAETKTVNLYASNLESQINVRVNDSTGNPVSGAGVVIDTISAMNAISYSTDAERQMKFVKTGTDGVSKLYTPAGTYYIRVYVPEGSKAIAPSEEKITLNTNDVRNVTISLRTESVSGDINIQGETKLDDGTLTNAFVWAWSENGGHEETNSSTYGNFSLALAKGQKWHIGAGKDSALGYYKSSELIIDTGGLIAPISLTLSKYGEETVSAPVVVGGKATEQIIAEGKDGVRFSLPASSVADIGPISVEVKSTVEAPSQAASAVVSKVYDITITSSSGTNLSNLSSEAEVTIPYDETELKNKGVSVENVIPSYFDESTGTWVAVSNYTIDKVKKVVILRVNHLTRFALIAAADTIPPEAPLSVFASAIKSSQGKNSGSVKISWKNPMKDIDHSKVYRSDESGKIGKVIATVVISESFIDESEFISGKLYYYTVRSVDTAGNESNNVNQVSASVAGGSSGLALSDSRTLLLPPGQSLSEAISRNLNIGSSGDDVKTLQRILASENVYPQAIISGYFGQFTRSAVIKFQEKYFGEILAPGGFDRGTGYVGTASRRKLNEILSKQKSASSASEALTSGLIVNSLAVGSAGEEVKILQNILIKEGVYENGKITGIFDSSTKKAVKLFQEKYASEILTPIGLSEGTGFFGAATRKKVNELISQ